MNHRCKIWDRLSLTLKLLEPSIDFAALAYNDAETRPDSCFVVFEN